MADVDTRRMVLRGQIRALLEEAPRSVYEVLRHFDEDDYRTVLQAWGDVRAEVALQPNNRGRYQLPVPPA